MIRKKQEFKPEILAPAGDKESFFAAVAAGADSIYCSLKNFSARMEADNFSTDELSKLSVIAGKRKIKLYLAMNSMVKDDELSKLGKLLVRVKRYVKPDALIVNDLALVELAKDVGIRCELHLSTLSGFTLTSGLDVAKKLGFSRVVLPREFNVDEIKMLASKKSSVELETFIHGALCYGVSGRCYWSSWLGGKSGLRGRCVQPCRRQYSQGEEKKSFFSCADLGLDVLVKVLQEIKEVKAWKIEGRKKTPHYVYYTVWGYKNLRDIAQTAKEKKESIKIFDEALGRPLTHYNFLPQRAYNPAGKEGETGSGKFVGRIKKDRDKFFLEPWEKLLRGDRIRVGYEGDPFHSTIYVPTSIPKGGKFFLRAKDFKKVPPSKTPVLLIDRKEPELIKEIEILEKEFNEIESLKTSPETFSVPGFSNKQKRTYNVINTFVKRTSPNKRDSFSGGVWVDDAFIKNIGKEKGQYSDKKWFWLPPNIWPEKEKVFEDAIESLIEKGARNFVVNSPWHRGLFKDSRGLNLWAGPFCNIANSSAINVLKRLGFSGVIVSPELSSENFLSLPKRSPLPLGIVTKGYFPFAVSRVINEDVKLGKLFISPKKETGFVKKYDEDYWIYPGWELDIKDMESKLKKAGYTLFAEMAEFVPQEIKGQKRTTSRWNWDLRLL